MWWMYAALAQPLDIALRGVCDGSAAVRVPNANLLVAYDEDRALHLYDLTGKHLASREVGVALKLPGKDEIDLEAAAANGHTIWWVGSHGNNKSGKPRSNRKTLFATNIPQRTDLSDLRVTQPRVDLTSTLEAAIPQLGPVSARPPKEGGVNIEGLAVHGDDGLMVGMRSPLTHTGKARVVQMKAGKVTRVHELDLGGRGVRSMSATRGGFLIVAGPTSPAFDFQLYRWDTKTTPTPISAPIAGLNVEALVEVAPKRWLVLSDDGAVERSDWRAKDGLSACKDIREDNPQGAAHPSVFARGRFFDL